MKEVWKTIEGYEGLYEVSSLGRVRSLNYNRKSETKLLSIANHNGYLRICLSKNNEKTNLFIHRLVAKTFIPNPENKRQVNHIDGDKTNNNVNNLEWTTPSENIKHAINMGLLPKLLPYKRKYKVIQYDLNGNIIKIWDSAKEVKKALNISNSQISKCAKGRLKTVHNYIWRYVKR